MKMLDTTHSNSVAECSFPYRFFTSRECRNPLRGRSSQALRRQGLCVAHAHTGR